MAREKSVFHRFLVALCLIHFIVDASAVDNHPSGEMQPITPPSVQPTLLLFNRSSKPIAQPSIGPSRQLTSSPTMLSSNQLSTQPSSYHNSRRQLITGTNDLFVTGGATISSGGLVVTTNGLTVTSGGIIADSIFTTGDLSASTLFAGPTTVSRLLVTDNSTITGTLSAGVTTVSSLSSGETTAVSLSAGSLFVGDTSIGVISVGSLTAGETSIGMVTAGTLSAGEAIVGTLSAGATDIIGDLAVAGPVQIDGR